MTNKSRGFVLVQLLVIFLLVGAGVWWYANNKQSTDATAGWQTYRNAQYGFEVGYPAGWVIEEYNATSQNVQIFLNPRQPQPREGFQVLGGFRIEASKEYKAGWENLLFDEETNGETKIGSYTWKTFLLPYGYADGPSEADLKSRKPMYGLQIVSKQILYSAIFWGQSNMTPLQTQILSTFKFTK